MLKSLEELLSMIIETPRKYGCSMYRNICMMALMQSPYLINEVSHSPHILGTREQFLLLILFESIYSIAQQSHDE